MRISDWSSDVCSSDLIGDDLIGRNHHLGLVKQRLGQRLQKFELPEIERCRHRPAPIALCRKMPPYRGLEQAVLYGIANYAVRASVSGTNGRTAAIARSI